MEQEEGNTLVIVVEVNLVEWANERLTLDQFISALNTFVQAFLLLDQTNQVYVIAVGASGPSLIHPPNNDQSNTSFREKLSVGFQTLLHKEQTLSSPIHAPKLSKGLALALCRLNALKATNSRCLAIQNSPDNLADHINFMNGVFAFQRLKIPLDTCQLSSTPSNLLEQASRACNGVYAQMQEPDQLLTMMVTSFLPGNWERQFMTVPASASIDYRASCFCHGKLIDRGFICPVCLAIYCSKSPSCAMCGSRFPPQLGLKRKTVAM